MQPYRDDFNGEMYKDDEEPHVPETVEFSQDTAASSRLKPMTVETDYDRSSPFVSLGVLKKVGLALLLFLGLLLIDHFFPTKQDTQEEYSTGRTFVGGGHTKVTNDCDGFDADYFQELMQRVQQWNQSQLCTNEFNIHACKCRHPLIPQKQDLHPGWLKVIEMNVQQMKNNYTSRNIQPEVVLYGDSITEHLLGRNYGRPSRELADIASVTDEMLTKRGGGHINGLIMGIAADQIAHLLYRIQKGGEMPESLQPKVWWINIGTNDIGMACSIDTVVAGNIRIVQQIQQQHHNEQGHKTLTPVVINSIFPRGKAELNSDHSAYGIIRRINQQLKCYADLNHGVYFVNATDLLTENRADGEVYLQKEYFAMDSLHPSALGSRKWEELIVENVMQLMTR